MEVGMLSGAREASDVHQRLDLVLGEQSQESIQGMIRVADGDNGWRHGVSSSAHCTLIAGRIAAEGRVLLDVEQVVNAVESFQFDRIYGAFVDMDIERNGMAVVQR
jgi:hypothetical protein